MFKKQDIIIFAILCLIPFLVPLFIPSLLTGDIYRELYWDNLTIRGHRAKDVKNKYMTEINRLPDYSPESEVLLEKMTKELDNLPLNNKLHNMYIKIPGFVVPLDKEGEFINEFLLVPYYGACIHSPPPPSNQVVYVKTSKENGISLNNSDLPFWVYGKLQTTGKNTAIGNAGYSILDANKTELYKEEDGSF